MTTETYGWSELSNLGKFGVISQGFGAIGGAVGSYYAAQSEKYKTKSLALNLQHRKDMALFNMRMKESQAQHIARTFNKQYQIMTLKQGAKKSTARASFAARGIQMGVGSTKDAFVSSELLADIDKATMNSNKVRATENKRLEAIGVGIKGDMYGLSASNMFATASSIDPFLNMSSSLLTGGANFISSLPPGMLRDS
tara:strand:+ start:443 stop:1033 length:591 start_codon:yes stop_codon:yes gene_type:complete